MAECYECSTKKTPVAAAFVCGQCEEVAYCSEACANKHWSIGMHHEECIPAAKIEARSAAKERARHHLSKAKAKKILHDKGSTMPPKQRGFFGWLTNE